MKIVFATNNQNKILEIQSMLPENISIISLAAIGCTEEVPETENTIEKNAIQKANYISEKYNCNCFADDTGLEVEILNNEPGEYSARYAGNQRNTDDNMNKLLSNLKSETNRKAQFKTIICLNLNGNQYLFTGIAKGEITLSKSGNLGFGYDPIFRPDGFQETFAEISLVLKNKISHRGKATQQLIEFLQGIKN